MTVFTYDLNRPLQRSDIRDSTTLLRFGVRYNFPLEPNTIPSTIRCLALGHSFNKEIKPGVIPNSVTSLEFGYRFNQELQPNSIPASVQRLIFGACYNKSLVDVIPPSVTHLTVGLDFNKDLNISPDTKIWCTDQNYILFTNMKFRHVRFYTSDKTIISTFNNNHILSDTYVITKLYKFKQTVEITLKLHSRQVKSSRKV